MEQKTNECIYRERLFFSHLISHFVIFSFYFLREPSAYDFERVRGRRFIDDEVVGVTVPEDSAASAKFADVFVLVPRTADRRNPWYGFRTVLLLFFLPLSPAAAAAAAVVVVVAAAVTAVVAVAPVVVVTAAATADSDPTLLAGGAVVVVIVLAAVRVVLAVVAAAVVVASFPPFLSSICFVRFLMTAITFEASPGEDTVTTLGGDTLAGKVGIGAGEGGT